MLLKEPLEKNSWSRQLVFASVAWEIWRKRNALRVGVDSIPYSKIFVEAIERLQEFQAARSDQILTSQRIGFTSWVPPPNPLLKVNFDEAVF